MTGPEFAAIRKRLGLTAEAFGRLLALEGSRAAINVAISQMEAGTRTITEVRARLAWMIGRHGVPKQWQAAASQGGKPS